MVETSILKSHWCPRMFNAFFASLRPMTFFFPTLIFEITACNYITYVIVTSLTYVILQNQIDYILCSQRWRSSIQSVCQGLCK